jgi:anaerobic magnesium-protoporphyrin IX monomethyl ester cyclase
MKILLVQPIVSAEAAYPMGLAAMVPGLQEAGCQVFGVDEHFDSLESMLALCQQHAFDWIGASVVEHNAEHVGQLLRTLRAQCGARIFVAGMWPSIHPSSALRRCEADIALIGAPERTVVDLMRTGRPGPGMASLRDGECQVFAAGNRAPLAELPLMDRTVFPVLRYSYAMRSTAMPYAMTFTSRGCARSCLYCPSPAQHPGGFDARPAAQIADEFEQLHEAHGIQAVHIEDDAFLTDRSRVMALCVELTGRGNTLNWELVNGVRPEHVDLALLQAMAEAGCARIVYSFEHLFAGGHAEVGVDIALARKVVAMTRRVGMRVGGYFIAGLPACGRRTTVRSLIAALQLGLDDANFVPFHPLPGSAYGERYAETTSSRRRAHWLCVGASAAFFLQPRTVKNFSVDLGREPKTLLALGHKAVELLSRGGPVPVRDNP